MAFTKEQIDALIAVLETKTPGMKCPSCGSNDWEIQDDFITALVGLSAPIHAKNYLPSVCVLCNVCGNTMLFNVFKLGVADVLGLARGGQ